jgi:hypothetical protein
LPPGQDVSLRRLPGPPESGRITTASVAGLPLVLEVRGQRGVLRAIAPTQTVMEQDTGVVVVAKTVFLEGTIRQ